MTKDIEESILCCLYIKNDLFKDLIVTENDFNDAIAKRCFQIFQKQYSDYQLIDVQGISLHFKHLFRDEQAVLKFIDYIVNTIIAKEPTASHFNYYQETLLKQNKNIKIMKAIDDFQKNKIPQEELFIRLHNIEANITVSDFKKRTADEIVRLVISKNKNIHFRFKKISKVTNLQEHDFLVVASRPGLGKTGFILNLLEDLSHTYKCILFNMEMSEQQVYRRLTGIISGVPIKHHDNPETDYQKKCIIDAAHEMAARKIKIFTGSQTIRSIKNRIINETKEEHAIIFIDYIGLIKSEDRKMSIYERVTSICQELRMISLDQNCTIVLVSQINRQATMGNNDVPKRPKLSELKDSGELEQSATTVIMLHSDSYYSNAKNSIEQIEIIIGKNRNGTTGIDCLNYNQENQRYEEIRGDNYEPNQWRKSK